MFFWWALAVEVVVGIWWGLALCLIGMAANCQDRQDRLESRLTAKGLQQLMDFEQKFGLDQDSH